MKLTPGLSSDSMLTIAYNPNYFLLILSLSRSWLSENSGHGCFFLIRDIHWVKLVKVDKMHKAALKTAHS